MFNYLTRKVVSFLKLHLEYRANQQLVEIRLNCTNKGYCPLVGPRPVGGVASVGVFLIELSPYLREFRRKTPNG